MGNQTNRQNIYLFALYGSLYITIKSHLFYFIQQHLEETDYANYLQNDSAELSIPLLRQKLKKKLADELDYISA